MVTNIISSPGISFLSSLTSHFFTSWLALHSLQKDVLQYFSTLLIDISRKMGANHLIQRSGKKSLMQPWGAHQVLLQAPGLLQGVHVYLQCFPLHFQLFPQSGCTPARPTSPRAHTHVSTDPRDTSSHTLALVSHIVSAPRQNFPFSLKPDHVHVSMCLCSEGIARVYSGCTGAEL